MNKLEAIFKERQLSGGVRVDTFEIKPAQGQAIQNFLREKGAKLYPNVKLDERAGYLKISEEISAETYAASGTKGTTKTGSKIGTGRTTVSSGQKKGSRTGETTRGGKVQSGGKSSKHAQVSDLIGSNPSRGKTVNIGWERLIQH